MWTKITVYEMGVHVIIIIFKGIYIAQVRKGHKCAMSAEMAVWLRNCLRWRHVTNTIERSMRGGDAAFCQLTLITCLAL